MNLKQSHSAESIQAFLVSHLAEVVGVETSEIDVNENLENYGLDSAQAMMIISKLEELLGFKPSAILLWHYPNIAALSQRLSEESGDGSQLQDAGSSTNSPVGFAPPLLDLAAEAVLDPTIQPIGTAVAITNPKNIFLTGGTGYLGAFIIKELLEVSAATLYCLVRASNVEEGKSKLENNLQQYGIWQDEYSARIIPIIGDLAQPHLGINGEQFQNLAADIDVIYHSAALLNYVYPYSALKTANVLGTQEVLRLACQTKVKPLHYVSSVAVFESSAYAGKLVKEDDDFHDWEGIFLGYSQTKWVAEKLVKIAGSRGLPITIHRPPLISGDSQTGICNTHDFINLMIKGCLEMGSFPDVDYMLDMSPVDYVSKSVVYLSRQETSLGKAFHLQHPQPASLKSLVDWVRSFGFSLKMIPYEEWQAELINNVTSQDNPLYTLRPFLLERWSDEQITIPDLYLQARRPIISCEATLAALKGSSIVCPTIDSQLLMTYTSYLVQTGFLSLA
ncbi:thioester reductase domain-containing protein [Dolichospermum sp. LEGE 00240]|uniref:thioester reductase domain-containing protein n=1 Tax=Dolichospermum sp. LEGE 00240 TaxID=1828603 RepID=UPI001882F2C5|nr:thioester reductase domain-containing protein [Dolichospermum sp. LEGE 00240]MBE9248896.1 thioester reductase domain-containing protein [Dolichospermum sp. LEGE 00240]MDM3847979.1 thioester reductase domain-containing protein [Aphanizomenon gracile PMC638.10]MDM3852933.1 thioester reductase domain-containing protein [Aphanizomenon gracile PMC627.10]